MYLIHLFTDRTARERPLIRRLADLDKKLFQATNELLILRKEVSEGTAGNTEVQTSPAVLRQLELQVGRTVALIFVISHLTWP